MSLIVVPAPDIVGVDTDINIDASDLDALDAYQYGGKPIQAIGGYLTLHEPESVSDLTRDKISLITARGYGLFIVQHCKYPGWFASAQVGYDLGKAASDNADAIGIPRQCEIYFDAEGVGNPGAQMIYCVQSWSVQIVFGYRLAGEYVGYDSGMTAQEHYSALPAVHGYWKAPGPWNVAVRGFKIRQQLQVLIGGKPYDPDLITADAKGDRLQMIIDPDAWRSRWGSLPATVPAA